jgi:hypothetical protein
MPAVMHKHTDFCGFADVRLWISYVYAIIVVYHLPNLSIATASQWGIDTLVYQTVWGLGVGSDPCIPP